MMENAEEQKQVEIPQEGGIGLYKIRYEMDVKGNTERKEFIAGIVSYGSKEAVDTLINFAKKKVKGFKGLKIEECGFEGNCHAVSDKVRDAIIGKAVLDGLVVFKEESKDVNDEVVRQKKSNKKTSIIPKEAKE